jgi:hypothetical protein
MLGCVAVSDALLSVIDFGGLLESIQGDWGIGHLSHFVFVGKFSEVVP